MGEAAGRPGRRAAGRPARGRGVFAALCLVLAAVTALPASSPADQAAPPEASREEELAAIRAEIARLQERIEQARAEAEGLAGELARLDLELELQQRRTAEAAAAREVAAARAEAATTELANLEASLAELRKELRRKLAGLYGLGRQGYLRLLLAVEPGTDLLAAVRQMRYLVRRDSEAIDEYQDMRTAQSRVRDDLEARRREVEDWRRSEEARRQELLGLRRRHATLLARAEAERETLAGRASELEAKERKLSAFLDLLYGRNESPLTGAPMQEFQGVLDWPVPGEVTQGFGPRRDPRYQTEVPHNGIELAVEAGGEVRVVYPGKVLFAAPFQGYGPTVVVHHAGRVFSLYAGLASLGVEPEDMVTLGQVLGTASPRLYFEIRVENLPEDPLDWLR